VSKINRLPDRTWSSAASGVIQLLVQLRPDVVLPHFVNVVDPQGIRIHRGSPPSLLQVRRPWSHRAFLQGLLPGS
jgi:hypothetical protein